MPWLVRNGVTLSNSPPFSMFCKMGEPCLNMKLCNSYFETWLIKEKILPKIYWSDAFRWVMEHIHAQVLKMLKSIVMGVKYLSINYDEMMFIDKQQ
jgi:hypothetical protein